MGSSKTNSILVHDDIMAESSMQPFIIGFAGGTASGKTKLCDMIMQYLHDRRVVLVNQGSSYHDLTAEDSKRVEDYNFDIPDAFDTELLLRCIANLRSKRFANIPEYDFKNNRRRSEYRQMLMLD